MPVVAYPNTSESFKRAIHEILSTNFDNTSHEYGDFNLHFPKVKIVFDIAREHLHDESTAHLLPATIAILGNTTVTQDRQKCLVDGKHGYELRAQILRTILVIAPYEGGSDANRNKAQQLVDTIWSRLHNLTTMGLSLFTSRNIHQPVLSILSDDVIRDLNIIEASGLFEAELRVNYTAYNT